MSAVMSKKEYALFKCAQMILLDQCPTKRKYYLCMEVEDDSAVDCAQCCDRYLWGIADGSIELSDNGRRAVV